MLIYQRRRKNLINVSRDRDLMCFPIAWSRPYVHEIAWIGILFFPPFKKTVYADYRNICRLTTWELFSQSEIYLFCPHYSVISRKTSRQMRSISSATRDNWHAIKLASMWKYYHSCSSNTGSSYSGLRQRLTDKRPISV